MWATLALLKSLLAQVVRRPGAMRRALFAGLAEEGLGLGLGVAAPFLLKRAVDRIGHASPLELAGWVTSFVLSWTAPSLIAALKLTRTADLVDGLYGYLAGPLLRQRLPALAATQGPDTGQLVGLLERLPFSLHIVLDGLVWRAGPLLGQLVLGLVALAWSLPLRYAALLGATLLAHFAIADLGATRLAERAYSANQAIARHSARLGDVMSNALRVVCNGAVELELAGLGGYAAERHAAQRASAQQIATTGALQAVALAAGLSLVLVIAGLDVAAHRLTVGDFVLLQAFALRLALPLSGLAMSLRQSGTPLANIREVLQMAGPPSALPIETASASIASADLVLDRVSYIYPDSDAGLRDVTLSLAPNQLVVVVGANGSGKSTLARLMAGLITPDQGCVLVGGAALIDLAVNHRPHSILYVPQYIGLFNRPLRDNGLYPPTCQTGPALGERLDQWAFHPSERPVDLDAVVGERGGRLSGGQVQKLELARLCAVDTPILVLDESTSALDAASEAEILRTLRARFAGRLLILVSHRVALAAAADQVVFLEAGRVAGLGQHATLMARPNYQRLWRTDA